MLPTAGSASAKLEQAGRALLSYVARDRGICLVRPDGTHAVRLTRWGAGQISWSPRGRYVAYERFAGLNQNHDPITKIAVADARGHVRWIFGASEDTNFNPLWSPDGGHIAYFSAYAHAGGFGVARPNGSADHGVFGCTLTGIYILHCPSHLAWAADDHSLAFDDRDDTTGDGSIFSVRLDGRDRRVLVGRAAQPAYSPDGSKLAYVGWSGIVVAAADGSNPRVIVPGTNLWWPTWSPDGTQIAFERSTDKYLGDVVVANADGSGEQTVASGATIPYGQTGLAWSPNGALIAFMRGQSLVVARADGGGEHVVVRRTGQTQVTPAWRPAVPLPAAKRHRCPA